MPQDKSKGVKQDVYSAKGDLLRTKTISDTSGYAAGRKKFTKDVTLPSGKSKSFPIRRAEASFIINNPKVALSKNPYSPRPYVRLDTPLESTPEPKQIQ
jgi:hypothetical protein